MALAQITFFNTEDQTRLITEYQHLDSGFIILPNYKQDVAISLKEDDGTNMHMKIVFIYDAAISKDNIHVEVEKDTMVFKVEHRGALMNFGFPSAIGIGTFNNLPAFFNFRIDLNSIQDSALIQYSFYTLKFKA